MDNLKVASLNVRGLRDTKKRKSMFNFFHREKLDVICVQESHLLNSDMWETKKYNGVVKTQLSVAMESETPRGS